MRRSATARQSTSRDSAPARHSAAARPSPLRTSTNANAPARSLSASTALRDGTKKGSSKNLASRTATSSQLLDPSLPRLSSASGRHGSGPPILSETELDQWIASLFEREQQRVAAASILADPRLFPGLDNTSAANAGPRWRDAACFDRSVELTPARFSKLQLIMRTTDPLVSEAIWTVVAALARSAYAGAAAPRERSATSSPDVASSHEEMLQPYATRARAMAALKLPDKALTLADHGFFTDDPGPRRAAMAFLVAYVTSDPEGFIFTYNRGVPLLFRCLTDKKGPRGADVVMQSLAVLALRYLTKSHALRDYLVGAGLLMEMSTLLKEACVEEYHKAVEPVAEDVGLYMQTVKATRLSLAAIFRNAGSGEADDAKMEMVKLKIINPVVWLIKNAGFEAERIEAIKAYSNVVTDDPSHVQPATEAVMALVEMLTSTANVSEEMESAILRALRATVVILAGVVTPAMIGASQGLIPTLSNLLLSGDIGKVDNAVATLREMARAPEDKGDTFNGKENAGAKEGKELHPRGS
ncbi:hypothetical protein HK101_008221 [Irineochytrium annulatum]|nr:hypothetical protein HK101_008221 [Irineochytrium annulatum]